MIHSRLVREYVTAKTLQGLRRKQHLLNAKAGGFFKFENEQQYKLPSGEIHWVAFYYKDLEDILKTDDTDKGED